MSRSNADLIREAFDAYNRHDLGDFLALMGAAGGTPVEQESWHVAEWRDGRIAWWAAYETGAEAIEAVERKG